MGSVNMAWFLFWALLAWSGTAGAQLSKKVGTDNADTDKNIKLGKQIKEEAFRKFTISAALVIGGLILSHFGS